MQNRILLYDTSKVRAKYKVPARVSRVQSCDKTVKRQGGNGKEWQEQRQHKCKKGNKRK